jgi:perosamine synthetase
MNGRYSHAFEKRFAEFSSISHAVSVNSCTTALEIVLKYINVAGGEVIVPTNTFIATANAVIFAGAIPVLADIKNDSYFLDPEELRNRITKKTKAVIAVHIAGIIPPEIKEIVSICQEHGIPLVEDSAHAMGATFEKKHAGSFGIAGCFSFYPTKITTTGSGGMIVTENDALAAFARSMRIHGVGSGLTDIVNIGNDWFLDEIRCAIGMNQMDAVSHFLDRRRTIAAHYDGLLATTQLLKKFPVYKESGHAYYKYPVQVECNVDVQEMKSVFPDKYGFQLESIYWPPCHLQPVYRRLFGYSQGDYPVAESILSRQITLPIHPAIEVAEADYAFECILKELASRL